MIHQTAFSREPCPQPLIEEQHRLDPQPLDCHGERELLPAIRYPVVASVSSACIASTHNRRSVSTWSALQPTSIAPSRLCRGCAAAACTFPHSGEVARHTVFSNVHTGIISLINDKSTHPAKKAGGSNVAANVLGQQVQQRPEGREPPAVAPSDRRRATWRP